MKRKTKLFLIGACLIICLCGVLFFLIQNDPTEEIIYTAVNESFEHGTPTKTHENIKPELNKFFDEYLPMIADASPEVQSVMKQFEPKFRRNVGVDLEIEKFLPTDEWLQKLLDMGISIDNYSDYSGWLNSRYQFWHAHNDPEDLIDIKDRLNLNANASWDEVVEAGIWSTLKLYTLADAAEASDSLVYGGKLSSNGVFIPFRRNTIYIQTNGTQVSSITGTGVPDWVPRELHQRAAGIPPEREIPKHVEVIFLDDAGKPVEEKIAQSRAQAFQLEPYLKGAAHLKPLNPLDTESVDRRTSISEDSDIFLETQTDASDMPNRPQPDADFNPDDFIPGKPPLDAGLAPKLPTDIPTESDFEQGLNDAERMLDEPESEDALRRRIETKPDELKERNKRRRNSDQ